MEHKFHMYIAKAVKNLVFLCRHMDKFNKNWCGGQSFVYNSAQNAQNRVFLCSVKRGLATKIEE